MKRIESTSNELVKHWARLQKDRSYRHSSQRVLVEGKNLLNDILLRHRPLNLIVTEKHLKTFADFPEECIVISDAIASKISSVEQPEGCFAEYCIPSYVHQPQGHRAIVLDGLQDPGNVGTILRTCLSFNVRTVFLIEPCCDPWNPKAIRAAKGAQFDLHISSCTWNQLEGRGVLFVADLHGGDIQDVSPETNWLLVLGNEAHGHNVPSYLHPHLVKIPMSGPMESLNVAQAGAILLYTLTRCKGISTDIT